MYRKKQTLEDDFGIWWNMPKYENQDFEARKYAKNMITEIGNNVEAYMIDRPLFTIS